MECLHISLFLVHKMCVEVCSGVWWCVVVCVHQCSQSCGGGVRSRGIRCVNDESGEEERAGLCGRSSRPDSSQECNPQECKTKTGESGWERRELFLIHQAQSMTTVRW